MSNPFDDVNWDRWLETIWTHGLRIILVAAAIYVALRLLRHFLGPAIRTAVSQQMVGQPEVEIEKRVDTLTHVIYRTAMAVAVVIGALTVLPELGVNIGALLASAGLIGLAIGIGAQSLVRDAINGTFILVENQYGKGDVVNLAGISGRVEDVNLRRTLLRDLDGTLHSIPNSAVIVASNLTRGWSRARVTVQVAHGEDLTKVEAAVNAVGEELARDPALAPAILEAPRFVRVEGLDPAGVVVLAEGVAAPGRQWEVAGELRRRLLEGFVRRGVRTPYAAA